MMYGTNGQGYPQSFPQGPTNNNLWFGNNYSSGNSQASRSMMGNPMNPNGMMQGMQQPMQQMQPMPQQMSTPQTMNNIIQVMGPESAVNYAVGPNSHIMMADSNRPVVYDKKSDDSGYSETKAFALTEIPLFEDNSQTQHQFQEPIYNENAKITALENEIEALKQEIVELKKLIED